MADARPRTLIRVTGIVVLVVAAALLTSIGGAGVVASPITLPAIYFVVRANPSRPFRLAGAVIGGLTAFEGVWGATYVASRGSEPLPTVLGLVAGAFAAVALHRVGTRRRRQQPRPTTG